MIGCLFLIFQVIIITPGLEARNVHKDNLRIIIERTIITKFEQKESCPCSFNLNILIQGHFGRLENEFVTMFDKSKILYTIQKMQNEYHKTSSHSKYASNQTIFYINEESRYYQKPILSSIICHNLRIKGIIIIGNSTFFISPQNLLYKTPLKIYRENDNSFYASSYQIQVKQHKSYYFSISKLPKRNVEIYLVADKSLVEKYLNEENTLNYIFEVFAYLNMILKQIMITAYPVKLIFEQEINLENYLQNIDYALSEISKYRQVNATDLKHDALHFISGLPFSVYSGRTYMHGICHFKKSVALITDYYSKNAFGTASTIAHEIAHSLGIDHDGLYCQCPSDQCIMTDQSKEFIPHLWSNCSIQWMQNLNETGMDFCLNDLPYPEIPKKILLNKNCLKAKQHRTKHCDSDLMNWDLIPSIFEHCCNNKKRVFANKPECFSGVCCDPITCSFLPSNNICRQASNECDIPEYCSGFSGICPPDIHYENGTTCNHNEGHCFNGKCGSATASCKNIFGLQFVSAREECYLDNTKGTPFQGHCGYQINEEPVNRQLPYRFKKCNLNDIFCGTLKCDFNYINKSINIKWQKSLENINYITYNDETSCYFGLYNTNLTGMSDPTMVPDGSPCGLNMYCSHQKCIHFP